MQPPPGNKALLRPYSGMMVTLDSRENGWEPQARPKTVQLLLLVIQQVFVS